MSPTEHRRRDSDRKPSSNNNHSISSTNIAVSSDPTKYPSSSSQQPPTLPPKHKKKDSVGRASEHPTGEQQTGRTGSSPQTPHSPQFIAAIAHSMAQQQQAPPKPPKIPTSSRYTTGRYGDAVKHTEMDTMIAELPGDMVGLGISAQGALRAEEKDKRKRFKRRDDGVKITSPKRKLRVLSLDGGGIRGYSTLEILSDLMYHIHVLTNNMPPPSPKHLPLPCQFFDIICGNGTGGLIALMLGRMRMDVETCKEYYELLTRYVFLTDKTILGLPYGKTLFKAARLEEAIKTCVRECTLYDHLDILPYDPSSPKNELWRRESPPFGVASTIGTSSGTSPRTSSIRRGSWGSTNRRSSGHLHKRNNRCNSENGNANFNETTESDHDGIGVYESTSPSPNASTSTVNIASTEPGSPQFRGRLPNTGPLGNPNAKLLDNRAGACKTFLTTYYAGSDRSTPPVLLRTYRSARDPNTIQHNSTIWEAGRATCATRTAFKPITIGTTKFLDEGYGKYNPAQSALEEATSEEEFPNSEVVCFVSIGTGKRQHNAHGGHDKHLWWEHMPMLEEYSEAKKRLISKLDDCENVHKAMAGEKGKSGLIEQRGLRREDYYRFNVEMGVGNYEMNEWNRLTEVNTLTRLYLDTRTVSEHIKACAEKLVGVWKEDVERHLLDKKMQQEDEALYGSEDDRVAAARQSLDRVKKASGKKASGPKSVPASPPPDIAELPDTSSSEYEYSHHPRPQPAEQQHQPQPYAPRLPPKPEKYSSAASPPTLPPRQATLPHRHAAVQSSEHLPSTKQEQRPILQDWLQQQTPPGGPIPIPSPGDFIPNLPPHPIFQFDSDPEDYEGNAQGGGDYFTARRHREPTFERRLNPEIRVISPTTVAGDSPRASPNLEAMEKRTIEGDRKMRREKREKKERERRERERER